MPVDHSRATATPAGPAARRDPVAPQVVTALPTPFRDSGEVDLAATRTLLRFVLPHVDGVFMAGTTGEFPALDDTERLALFEVALAEAGPERVIAHVGAPSAVQAARLARGAVTRGVTRLAAITPYYLPAGPEAVLQHFREVAAAAEGVDLYAYLFPECTGVVVKPGELAGLPGLSGGKLSGSAAAAFGDFADVAPPGFALFSGDDSRLPDTVAAGGRGVVSGMSAAFPELFVTLRAAVGAGDDAEVDRVQEIVRPTAALLGSGGIPLMKAALEARGLPAGRCRMALDAPDPDAVARIRRLAEDPPEHR